MLPVAKHATLLFVLAILPWSSCNCEDTQTCSPGQSTCIDLPDYVLLCNAEGTQWQARRCQQDQVCVDDDCRDLTCVPNSSRCLNGAVQDCSDDGKSWLEPQACSGQQSCYDGACVAPVCSAFALRCSDNSVEQCTPSGQEWQFVRTCTADQYCRDGVCLSDSCRQGETECGPHTLYICRNGQWLAEPCGDDSCLFGVCVECMETEQCAQGLVCEQGRCTSSPPRISTSELPAATLGQLYSAQLSGVDGATPYHWSLKQGDWPNGVSLSDAGLLSGTPTEVGEFEVEVELLDAADNSVRQTLQLNVYADGLLQITTTALPNAEHGLEYDYNLEAMGGLQPYAWQLLNGTLPEGIALGAGGQLQGAPQELGDFAMAFRVFDASEPPNYTSREFTLHVEIAPLMVAGERSYNLLLTRLVVLPTLIPYVPYVTQLEAQGGLAPYVWSLQDPPTALTWLISQWGLPQGLELSSEGRFSGWVTDVSDALTIQIPMGPQLTGYFIYVRVVDSQNPSDSDEAIVVLPTVSLN